MDDDLRQLNEEMDRERGVEYLQTMLDMEREQAAVEALERLKEAGAGADDLEFLAGELGIRKLWTQWRGHEAL